MPALDFHEREQRSADLAAGVAQLLVSLEMIGVEGNGATGEPSHAFERVGEHRRLPLELGAVLVCPGYGCLLYTSDAADE